MGYKNKRIIIIISLLVLLLSGCGKDKNSTDLGEKQEKVALLLGVGGLGDQGYNDLAFEGAKKAEAEFGIKVDSHNQQLVRTLQTRLMFALYVVTKRLF